MPSKCKRDNKVRQCTSKIHEDDMYQEDRGTKKHDRRKKRHSDKQFFKEHGKYLEYYDAE